jgi:RNA polymerase primary sigma factor
VRGRPPKAPRKGDSGAGTPKTNAEGAHELTNIVETTLRAFLEEAEERGTTTEDELDAFALEHDLDAEQLAELRLELDARAIEIEEREETEPAAGATAGRRVLDDYDAAGTTDSLTLFMNAAGRHPLLSAAREVELAKRVERGDRAAKEEMINCNLRLVISIAKRYQGHGVPLPDLIQEGVIGLNRAVEKFDWRRGFKFSTYATWWIRQSCQRAISNLSTTIRIPTHVHERRVRLARARQRLEAERGTSPTAEELAEATGLDLRHVEEALGAVESSTSLNQQVGSEGDAELGDLFADPAALDPAEEASASLHRLAVRKAVAGLPEQERRLIELRFGLDGEPQSIEAIGRELGMTRERVRKVEREAFAKLAHSLGEISADEDADDLAVAA